MSNECRYSIEDNIFQKKQISYGIYSFDADGSLSNFDNDAIIICLHHEYYDDY